MAKYKQVLRGQSAITETTLQSSKAIKLKTMPSKFDQWFSKNMWPWLKKLDLQNDNITLIDRNKDAKSKTVDVCCSILMLLMIVAWFL
jgi:hypothetical protein